MTQRTERWLLTAIGFLTILLATPYVQCLGDDTFIYMRVIENFLASGQIEYNSGEPAYLVTSTTWFFLWTAFAKLLGDVDIARYVLSTVFHGCAILTTWLVSRYVIRSAYLRLAVVAIAFLDPFYMRWMWAGWETGMKITMASLSLWALLRLGSGTRGRGFFLTGVIAGFALLTRPEMIVVVGLGLAYILSKTRGGISSPILYVLGVITVTAPWMVYAQLTFGWAVPHTIFVMSGTEVSTEYLVTNGMKFVKIVGTPQTATALIILFAILGRVRDRDSGSLQRFPERTAFLDWALVAVWAAASVGYLVTGSYIASIYTGLFVPGITLALAGGAEFIAPRIDSRWLGARPMAIAMVLGLLVSIGIQTQLFYRYSIFNPAYRGGVDERFIDFATKVGDLTEPDAEIGLWELGVIGYFSKRYIVDFAGLATPEIVIYARQSGPKEGARRFLTDRNHWPEYMVRHYGRAEHEGKNTEPREFFGVAYEPIWSQRIDRVGGGRRVGDFDVCVLYRRIESSPAPSPVDGE